MFRYHRLSVVLLAVVLAPFFSASAQEKDRVLAIVNGQSIRWSQAEVHLKRMGPQAVTLTGENQRVILREVLAMMIDDLLLEQFLTRHVPSVNPKEIDSKVAEMEAEFRKRGKTLQDYYRDTRKTEAELRRSIKEILQWTAYAKKNVTDEQLKKYYSYYRDFFDRVVVRASHIGLQIPPGAPKSAAQEAIARLKKVREEIQNGKLDFAEAARKHSKCPSAADGGDIGTFPRKYVVDENFARAAFSLKPGEVSDVVKTDYGYHLIKLTERKPAKPVGTFVQIKEQVREHYMEEFREKVLAQLRKSAKIKLHLDDE